MANRRLYPFWGNLTAALRTGEQQNEIKEGGPSMFAGLYADPATLKEFLKAMTGISRGANLAIANKFPWKNYQRHTAHRISERIRHELPDCKIGERTVRHYVHDRKIALGMLVRETCVPQSYALGVEAQVDWYEAYADLAGERVKLQVFAMRSMASGAAFHCAYLHATQQVLLEAHELAFAYFGGVFRKLHYDNLTSSVKKILRGHRREETAR